MNIVCNNVVSFFFEVGADYSSASVDSLRAAIALALPPPPESEATLSTLERARRLMLAGAVDSHATEPITYFRHEPVANPVTIPRTSLKGVPGNPGGSGQPIS